MKILTILGARPQFIKAALVSKELHKQHQEIIIHTGQHYDQELSDTFFKEMGIPQPDYNLGIPEEINRIITDHVSTLLFALTQACMENLQKEGLTKGVYLTGDVMLDSFEYFSQKAEKSSQILDQLGLQKGKYLLATVYRARNTDIKENLQNICEAFLDIAKEEKLVFPVHPRTEKYLKQYGLNMSLHDTPNIIITKPVGYLDMLVLTKNARKILTDSGGLQKEACFAGVPCITLDTSTGWPETVEDGWNILVSLDKDKIIEAIKYFEPSETQRDMFGDGKAAQKIVKALANR